MGWTHGQAGLIALLALGVGVGCPKPKKQDPPDAGDWWPPPVHNTDAGDADAGTDAGVVALNPIVDLRADSNRDGVVSFETDDGADKLVWTADRGAVFLANIDDDTRRCPLNSNVSDIEAAACHDAADEIINGDDDLLDLAYLKTRPWPDAPADAYGSVKVNDAAKNFVRLFRKVNGEYVYYPFGDEVFFDDLRAGLELAIEGRDIVRDPAVWDGFVNVTFEVNYYDAEQASVVTVTDAVRMRVAPVITFDHTQKSETVYVTSIANFADSTKFQNEISAAVVAAGLPNPLYKYPNNDQWTQDFFETGYMSMPKANGEQHVIRVNYRSANVENPNQTQSPLRRAGRIVFTLRGKDVAAVQQYSLTHSGYMQSLNSFGNTETIPPYSLGNDSYPLGRSLRGRINSFYPDPTFTRMMEAQAVQPPLYVDTAWLLVAHVDETVSFLKANNARGWVVLVNDAKMAMDMLNDAVANGHGSVPMFVGKQTWNASGNGLVSAQRTINQVLADTDVMNDSTAAIAHVNQQLNILKAATGITEEEIIRIPFLHEPVDGYSLAYQPGTVNMLVIDDKVLAVPDPFGPNINGQDIFKAQLQSVLAPLDYQIHWIDNWNLYHINAGEVHCGTNAAREIPSVKWWETGR